MVETIRQCNRRARKRHVCDYCGEVIKVGETYDYAVLKYDGMYVWKSHSKCISVAADLWDYADLVECMTQEDFQTACNEFCREFVCPDCASWNDEDEECRKDEIFCVDKIYSILQTHDFVACRNKYGIRFYKLKKKRR